MVIILLQPTHNIPWKVILPYFQKKNKTTSKPKTPFLFENQNTLQVNDFVNPYLILPILDMRKWEFPWNFRYFTREQNVFIGKTPPFSMTKTLMDFDPAFWSWCFSSDPFDALSPCKLTWLPAWKTLFLPENRLPPEKSMVISQQPHLYTQQLLNLIIDSFPTTEIPGWATAFFFLPQTLRRDVNHEVDLSSSSRLVFQAKTFWCKPRWRYRSDAQLQRWNKWSLIEVLGKDVTLKLWMEGMLETFYSAGRKKCCKCCMEMWWKETYSQFTLNQTSCRLECQDCCEINHPSTTNERCWWLICWQMIRNCQDQESRYDFRPSRLIPPEIDKCRP